MPWKECDPMSERLKFVSRLLEGERMSDLCQEFGISRKTGYKILERYQKKGVLAFTDQSRRPHRSPNQTPDAVSTLIIEIRQKHPSWGAPKIRDYLAKKHPSARIPASSTIHVILERHSLIGGPSSRRRLRKGYKAEGTTLYRPRAPNDLWCSDFKGQFRLGNGQYCYPLTITDQFSRYLLCVDAHENTREQEAIEAFYRTFEEHGLPRAIRTDNGVPFSTRSLFGLSKLSLWWLRLGIRLERIEPGKPQQNGAHERMHLTLKQATTRPPGKNLLHQQEIFDSFIETFNQDRPHDGIAKKCPVELYQKSTTLMPSQLPELEYPGHERTLRVTSSGQIRLDKNRAVYLSTVLSGQRLGIQPANEEGIWVVSFMDYDLGYFDEQSLRFTPKDDPFDSEKKVEGDLKPVSPMSPE